MAEDFHRVTAYGYPLPERPEAMQSTHDIEQWLRIHRLLMEKEAAFTDLAIRAVDGSVSRETLDQEREALMALRELCTSMYEKAFPKSG